MHVYRQKEPLKEANAAEIRAKTNNRLSLLDGVPISWKDLFDSKGY
jgi:aspartyl-tRNA(Asn)/glutamyl-tRNA(Gln) amidotransferase subunit A